MNGSGFTYDEVKYLQFTCSLVRSWLEEEPQLGFPKFDSSIEEIFDSFLKMDSNLIPLQKFTQYAWEKLEMESFNESLPKIPYEILYDANKLKEYLAALIRVLWENGSSTQPAT